MVELNISRDSDDTLLSSISQDKEFEGYLMFRKKQAFSRTWKRRFIVFRAPYLWVYDSPSDKKFLYQFDLSSYDSCSNDPTNKKSIFGIVIFASRLSLQPTTSSHYPIIHLCASDDQQYSQFMKVINEFINNKKEEAIDRITGRVTSLHLPTSPNHLINTIDTLSSSSSSSRMSSISSISEDKFYSQGNQSAFEFKYQNGLNSSSPYNRRPCHSYRKNSVHY
ncbi:hypothetical protein K502DRAFT_362096 [Neoconidiobolus thromboides FSU 785]|nr:hypothetical protein K502DRAFT_362096 [Neoconidiobolus thromboides FSU 785]